jgi:hypothetical protein
MYRVMAGIDVDPLGPGYKHILIQPQPGGGFTSVRASHMTMYGKVSSAWTLKNDNFELSVEIPANTRATVRLPGARLANITEAGKALSAGNGITGERQDGDIVVVEIGSGQYRFAFDMSKPAQTKVGKPAADISGKWHFVFNTEGGEREESPTFQQEGDRVTGKWGKADVQGTFKDGQLDLSFPFTSEEAGTSGTLKVKGNLDGDTLKGTWEFDTYSGTFTATRVK